MIGLFAFPSFLWLLIFFIRKKRQFLEEKNQTFTPFNYFVIAWIFFMWFLKLIHGIAMVYLVTLRRFKIHDVSI
jgi:hypothetical protein